METGDGKISGTMSFIDLRRDPSVGTTDGLHLRSFLLALFIGDGSCVQLIG